MSRAKIQIASLPTATLGILLAAENGAELIDFSVLLYIILFFTVLTYSCQINCLNDLEVDEKYKKYLSNAVKSLSIPTLKKMMVVELSISGLIIVLLCFLEKNMIYSFAILGIISGYVYSAPPFRIKKRGVLSPFPVMFGLYFFPIIAGWFIVNGRLSFYIILFGAGYALIMQGITFINTCEDFEEDRTSGIRTLVHVLGIKKILILGSLSVLTGGMIDLGLLSYRFKPSIIGIFPSTAVLVLSIFFLGTIVNIANKLCIIGKSSSPLLLCKKYAVKMPKWFLITRYPLFIICLLLLLYR